MQKDIKLPKIIRSQCIARIVFVSVSQLSISFFVGFAFLLISGYSLNLAIIIACVLVVALEMSVSFYLINSTSRAFIMAHILLSRNYNISNSEFNNITNSASPALRSATLLLCNTSAPRPVTQHNKARDNMDMVQAIFAALPVGVIVLNNDFKIVYANHLAPIATFNGYDSVQLDFSEASVDLEKWLNNAKMNKLSDYRVWPHIQNTALDKDAERRFYDVVVSYQRNAANSCNTIILAVDRTAWYSNNDATMDTLALAAHELRGPIATLRGYIDLLHDEVSPHATNQRKLLSLIDVSTQRLSTYITNILNASRYDHQGLRISPRQTNLIDIIQSVQDDLGLRASTGHIKLDWSVEANLPSIFVDPSAIGEVITNLVDNAIKYSYPGGKVTIAAKVSDGFLAIAVKDHGVGIPSELLQNIFDKFYRSHYTNGTVSGSGLGLYITRAIVKCHHGYISAESGNDDGTTFTVWLPLNPADSNKVSSTDVPFDVNNLSVMHNHNKIVL